MNSWKLDKEIKKSLVKLIDRRKENRWKENPEKCPKDLLGLMIEETVKKGEMSWCPSSKITVQDIVEECKSFFFAGKQTTSNLLTWTTVLLAMHPQWQVRARDEVFRVCGARDTPTKDDVVKLKTVMPPALRQIPISFVFYFPFVSWETHFLLSSLKHGIQSWLAGRGSWHAFNFNFFFLFFYHSKHPHCHYRTRQISHVSLCDLVCS